MAVVAAEQAINRFLANSWVDVDGEIANLYFGEIVILQDQYSCSLNVRRP
jgi:hypothetical protein